jgi:hypothetical protein
MGTGFWIQVGQAWVGWVSITQPSFAVQRYDTYERAFKLLLVVLVLSIYSVVTHHGSGSVQVGSGS